ncbi:MAG: hypothetical protein HYZ29_06085 [Myxococcales bacterium]|nr:hypothetical protein [Myxococcales bacterium]
MRKTLEAFASGVLVYVIVAACSAAGGGGSAASSGGGSAGLGGASQDAPSGTGGGTGMGGAPQDSSLFDAVADALTGPVPDAQANQSGTRLRARRYVATDGASQFVGWHDSQRKEDCQFMTTAEGKLRCVPTAMIGEIGSYFPDATCSNSLFLSTACAPPKYGMRSTLGSACTGYSVTVFGLGPAVPGTQNVYVKNPSTGACTSTANPYATTAYTLYQAGPEVPASSFVEATQQID